ncbi:MAG: FAD-binding protein, partial [Nanoarchaeota archaeon]
MIGIQEYIKKKQYLVSELKNSQSNSISINKKTSNLFRSRDNSSHKIDVKNFNNVISIDTHNLIAEVEGMCTYETLVDECLKFNLMPSVVPELKTITIGGAATGVGIESSSFKFGFVHETILEMEILLSDGSVV